MSEPNQALIEARLVLKDNLDEGMEYDSEGDAVDETHPGYDVVEGVFKRHELGGVSVLMVMGKDVVFECTEASLASLRELVSEGIVKEITSIA
tara:strand:- start:492 stop:770 length:279 start_codon:yes stop_codon:yes gene_type:complete